jgi:hypothetical protein
MPVPVGRVSLRLAEMAVTEPVLLTASVYPIEEPAVTVAASAVLLKARVAHCTVAVADDCTVGLLLALKDAVLV